jgi:metal-responsive CopG/Arc/MetJ family transcriptional regulator
MRTRTKKTVTTSLPQEELAELDRVRRRQGISRSEAVRDAIRWYVGAVGRLPLAEEMLPDEAEAIRRGKEQIARGKYVRLEDLQNELGLLTKP